MPLNRTFQSLQGIATATQVCLAFSAVFGFAAILTGLPYFIYLYDLGDESATHEVTNEDMAYAVAGALDGLANITVIVSFLIWFYRIYKNLSALGYNKLDFSPGWAVAYFFIPILSFFRPYQVAQEMWKKSGLRFQSDSGQVSQAVGDSGWIKIWWGVFLVFITLDRIGGRLMLRAETIDAEKIALGILILSNVFQIAAAFSAFVVVRDITQRQLQAFHALQAKQENQLSS